MNKYIVIIIKNQIMKGFRKTEITEFNWRIKWLSVQIKKWYTEWLDKPIFNTYIIIKKENLWEDLKKILLEWKESRFLKSTMIYEYEKIEDYFDFHSWITFYEKQLNWEWKLYAIKIWNDYNHISDSWETFESIKKDLEKSIEVFVTKFPNYLVWSWRDWSYEKYNKDNKYHN